MRSLAVLVLLVRVAPAFAAPPPAPALSADECVVWKRELGFADALARHDAAAFAGHVAEHAVFGASNPEPERGRALIVQRWAELIEGRRRVRVRPRRLHARLNAARLTND